MNLNISDKEYEDILNEIRNEENPVGIDAGKVHVLILHKLMNIERRLEALEMKFFEEEE